MSLLSSSQTNANDNFLSESDLLSAHSSGKDDLSKIPKSRSRSGTLSQLPLSLLSAKLTSTPSSPAVSSHSMSRQLNRDTFKLRQTHSRDRNHGESKKLLAHILHELENRLSPPPIFDEFNQNNVAVIEKRLDAIVQNVKDVSSKLRVMPPSRLTSLSLNDDDSDEDEVTSSNFATDNTYALMVQLRDVLLIARSHGWHIFDDRYDFLNSYTLKQ